mgnify:CR=1 FL=1
MNETLGYALAALILPPTSLGLLALVGLWRGQRGARWGWAVAWVAVCALLVLSVPAVALRLARVLEPAPIVLSEAQTAQAVVILGAGRSLGAHEWGGETVSAHGLVRVRYGAALARELGLPILLSGGRPGRGRASEAALMQKVLLDELHTPARWLEEQSHNTGQNAQLSAQRLRADGIDRVVLVTSALHMPRAAANFRQQGLQVWPAPTDYQGQVPFAWGQLIPSAQGLALSTAVLREWVARGRDVWVRSA